MLLQLLALSIICTVSFIMKIPYFKLPLDRDYGGHGYIAYCWLKGKALIYRDHIESKTPGLKIIYMIIIKWLGINRKAFRLFFALYNILTTIAVFALGTTLFSSAAGLVAASLYALYSSVPSYWWHFSNIESYYVLPMVLSFFCIAKGFSPSISYALIAIASAGFFSSVAFMFKQPALITTTAPGLFFLLLYAPHGPITDVGLYLAGFSLPVIVFFVYFVLIHKTPLSKLPFSPMMLKIIWRYCSAPLFKANRAAIESNRRRFKGIFYDSILLCILTLGGIFSFLSCGPQPLLMLVAWIAMAFLGAILGRTYLAYHFIPTIPPMCVFGGIVICKIVATVCAQGVNHLSMEMFVSSAAVIVLFLIFVYHLIKDLLLSPELMGMFYSGEDQLYALCEEVGKYIKTQTTEDDYVYSWGHQPDIYFWSERRAPVYSIYPPIVNPAIFTRENVVNEFAQLLAHKPKYFVLTSDFGKFKEFEEFLIHNYVIEKKYEPYLYLFKAK